MRNKKYDELRLILGDQLNAQHSWYKDKKDNILYVIAELKQETAYVRHHIQKLCAFFAAMENFAEALAKADHHVLHLTLDDTIKFRDFPHLLRELCKHYGAKKVAYQRPDEYRLSEQLANMRMGKDITVECHDTEHFLLPFNEIPDYFTKDQHVKMEFFYRKMRKRYCILMEGDKPAGDRWNFDAENRHKLKPTDLDDIPAPLIFANDVKRILARLKKHKVKCFGKADESLLWPVSRRQSQDLLRYFCENCLARFGTFQDAMTSESEHKWSLYHSRLSFAINSKMLNPLQVVEEALAYYQDKRRQISLAQIEGFVRQIIGWREYIRGVYWRNMPDYARRNHLNAKRKLPEFFWTGETKMKCMQQAIKQSLDYAYAHHIQRLMVTGNFCLIAGIDPSQVDHWYLGIYVDAIEWVEMPNTRGMSQFADGGLIATKPYAAGGNYINKMSDYCKGCHYTVKDKTGESACPLNSLYWNFMLRHRERLENNPRIGMIYRNWDKQNAGQCHATLERANWCLENLDKL